jgi:AcrR family transcriptional regulator
MNKAEAQSDNSREQQIRQRIIDAASQEFMQYGISRISMDDIAEKLSMSKKTLYRYFTGKEDLIRAVMLGRRKCFDDIHTLMEKREENQDFVSKMLLIGSMVAEQISQIPLSFIRDLERTSPEIWREQEELKKTSITRGFRELYDQGVQAGVLRSDLPPDLASLIHFTLIHNLFRPDVLMSLPYTPVQLYHAIMSVLMDGLYTDYGRCLVQQKKNETTAHDNLPVQQSSDVQ